MREGPDRYPSPPSGNSAQGGAPDWSLHQGARPAAPSVSEAPLGYIGDITITHSQVVTPAGPFPLRGTIWTVTDMSRTEQYMPAYAVVLAIIFFIFCLLGLLFLLIKESRTTGAVQVTVQGAGHYHSTMIPVSEPRQVYAVLQQVNWARSLAAQPLDQLPPSAHSAPQQESPHSGTVWSPDGQWWWDGRSWQPRNPIALQPPREASDDQEFPD
jgi:hypothetical protein